MENKSRNLYSLIPIGIAINIVVGFIATTLKLPIYLDAIGTIIVTILGGLVPGILTGILSFLLGGLLTNPVLPYFILTQAVIAIYLYHTLNNGWYKKILHQVLCGIGLGIVAGIVSAPVIVYLFGGITGSGRSLITAFLLASGEGILESVIYSGLTSEPIDKTIQILLGVFVVKGLPRSLKNYFRTDLIEKNNF